MIISILTGVITASVVIAPRYMGMLFPVFPWKAPMLLLALGAFSMFLYQFLMRQGNRSTHFHGIAELFVYIHKPLSTDSPLRWVIQGIISFFLSLFGGVVASEGAAIELAQAFQMKVRASTSKWFEQRRRSDVASSLSAAIAAAFGAPFAACLLPIELGIGGRTLTSVMSAISAFLVLHFFINYLSLDLFDIQGALAEFHFLNPKEWLATILIGLIMGGFGFFIIHFTRYFEEGLSHLFQTRLWMRSLSGAVLLCLLYYLFPLAHDHSLDLLEHIFWSHLSVSEVMLILCISLFALALALSSFGTLGIFWPLFTLGGGLGFCVNQFLLGGTTSFLVPAGLVSAAALWGAVLGVPISGAILVFELTQNIHFILPCFVAAFLAKSFRYFLKTPALIYKDLNSIGLQLMQGKSVSVLNSILIRDAMITDHEMVHEQEPIAALSARILKSPYPFLPVVNTQGVYLGLITVDLIRASCNLPKILEAKDLLYLSQTKVPAVKFSDPLSSAIPHFEKLPCVPVLGEDRQMMGLLFIHQVRFVYDRELARQSFAAFRDE